MQVSQPYIFPSHHRRILQPYNYYNFGQRYIRGLVDFEKSLVGHIGTMKQIASQLAAGDNVILLANHQTEADPAVFALLLEAELPSVATDVIYVAGDRVVTDPLCAPFSMGRNLFCVHSKKHLDDVPELKAEKMATNRRTLKAMQTALAEGGKLLWIAPSGGRDRSRHPTSDITLPDKFDASAVELMRALSSKAAPPAHLYPFAMYSYQIMPPPQTVSKSIGEERRVFHAAVGVSVCPELHVDSLLAGIPANDKEKRQSALADAAWKGVFDEYQSLVDAIDGGADNCGEGYSQPWKKYPQPALDQWL
jgi:glycerol-3-phosphate O-acyltransferase